VPKQSPNRITPCQPMALITLVDFFGVVFESTSLVRRVTSAFRNASMALAASRASTRLFSKRPLKQVSAIGSGSPSETCSPRAANLKTLTRRVATRHAQFAGNSSGDRIFAFYQLPLSLRDPKGAERPVADFDIPSSDAHVPRAQADRAPLVDLAGVTSFAFERTGAKTFPQKSKLVPL
jgi:hypothetical protein